MARISFLLALAAIGGAVSPTGVAVAQEAAGRGLQHSPGELAQHVAAEAPVAAATQSAGAPIPAQDWDALRDAVARQGQQLEEQARQLDEQSHWLDSYRQALEEQRRQLDVMQLQLVRGAGAGAAPGAAKQAPAPEAASPGAAAEGATRPAEAERAPEVPVLVERGGILLPRGLVVVEPSIDYTHSDVTRVEVAGFTVLPAILIGSFDLSDADRDSLTGAVTVRYGVTDRFEIEGKVPYVYRDDSTTGRPLGEGAAADVTTSVTGHDIGDIEAGAHYQINRGRGGWPFFIGNVRVKSNTGTDPFEVERDPRTQVERELPTGTGFWGFEGSVTTIYPSDPAVLFANVSYLYNLERDVGGGFGKIDPGDAIGFNFGLGIGLNERLSFSLSYDHSIVDKTEQNGETVQGSRTLTVGRLIFNTSYGINDWMSTNLSAAFGVTEDAPDIQLILRLPMTFDLSG